MKVVRTKRWHVLVGLIQQHGWRCGAELGVLDGDNLFHLLDNCPGLQMIGVDRWKTYEDYPKKDMETSAYLVQQMVANFYRDRCRILVGDTSTMANEVKDGVLDFVFIDAGHKYEEVLADIEAWRPKLKPNGRMLGHDIDWPGVHRAVCEVYDHHDVLPDDVWMAA